MAHCRYEFKVGRVKGLVVEVEKKAVVVINIGRGTDRFKRTLVLDEG